MPIEALNPIFLAAIDDTREYTHMEHAYKYIYNPFTNEMEEADDDIDNV